LGYGYTIAGLEVVDNVGLHPVLPVKLEGATTHVQRQTRALRVVAEPTTGDWGIGDIVRNVAASGSPDDYVCTVAGSFGPSLTCTASGTVGNYFFTCSAIEQLHVGQHFGVAGAGPASANLRCTCVYIEGTMIYVDQTISTTVTAAAMALTSPVFVKSGNQS
jgi:hypothetical protein